MRRAWLLVAVVASMAVLVAGADGGRLSNGPYCDDFWLVGDVQVEQAPVEGLTQLSFICGGANGVTGGPYSLAVSVRIPGPGGVAADSTGVPPVEGETAGDWGIRGGAATTTVPIFKSGPYTIGWFYITTPGGSVNADDHVSSCGKTASVGLSLDEGGKEIGVATVPHIVSSCHYRNGPPVHPTELENWQASAVADAQAASSDFSRASADVQGKKLIAAGRDLHLAAIALSDILDELPTGATALAAEKPVVAEVKKGIGAALGEDEKMEITVEDKDFTPGEYAPELDTVTSELHTAEQVM